MLPFSTNGRNASCCALLNLCISSTKSTVRLPICLLFSASFITAFISLIPLVTALKLTKSAFVLSAIIPASVVLPTPGGPQKIIDDTSSFSMMRRNIFPFPRRCSCPTNPSSVVGLILLASGALICLSSKSDICSMFMPAFYEQNTQNLSWMFFLNSVSLHIHTTSQDLLHSSIFLHQCNWQTRYTS